MTEPEQLSKEEKRIFDAGFEPHYITIIIYQISNYRKWIMEDSPNQHKTTYDHPSTKPVNIIKKLLLISCPPEGKTRFLEVVQLYRHVKS